MISVSGSDSQRRIECEITHINVTRKDDVMSFIETAPMYISSCTWDVE